MTTIHLPSFLGWVTIPMSDIVRLEGKGNYTIFILADGQRLIYSKTISMFEGRLPFPFVRVHKSTIINLLYLSQQNLANKKLAFFMTDGFAVAISRRRRNDVKSWLKRFQQDF
jgi:DNA-binding LytR/AlgR family response regulator